MSDTKAYLTISEGKFHQVKRMFKFIGCEVTYLKRVQFKNLDLEGLEIGDYRHLTDEEISKIRKELDNHLLEGDLRREVSMNIKTKMEIGSYQGIRHRKGLPVRGQSTRSNARTRKGRGKTVANKKK